MLQSKQVPAQKSKPYYYANEKANANLRPVTKNTVWITATKSIIDQN